MKTCIKTFAIFVIFFNMFSSPVNAEDRIRFVYFDQFEPFSWADNKGRMRGVFIDAVDEVFNVLRIEVTHEGYPWKRAQFMVEKGQADGMCTVSTDKRLEYTVPTIHPVVQMEFKIFTSIQNPRLDELKKVSAISDLKGFRLVDILGSGWAENNLKGMDLDFEPTYPTIFKLLADGIYDAAVRNNVQTNYLIKKFEYQGKLIELPQTITQKPTSYRVLIGKKSILSTQVEKINEALKLIIDNGTLNRISKRYQ